MNYLDEPEGALPDIKHEAPVGLEVVGYWCWRAGGHLCDESCKSDSVPLFAQSGWAAGVRRNIQAVRAVAAGLPVCAACGMPIGPSDDRLTGWDHLEWDDLDDHEVRP